MRHPNDLAVMYSQQRARKEHPELAGELPGEEEEASEELKDMLHELGHPQAEGAFVVRHRNPAGGASHTVFDSTTGAPGVALHPERWDRGTLAHEAGHIMHAYDEGRGLDEPVDAEHRHNADFMQHYRDAVDTFALPSENPHSFGSDAGDALQRYYGLGQMKLKQNPDVFQVKPRMSAKAPFEFRDKTVDTGASRKYQFLTTLTAHHPETGELAGELRYYPPFRKKAPLTLERVEGHHPGAASALMTEMESRHPDSRVIHLDDQPLMKGPKKHDSPLYGTPTDWKSIHPELPEQIHRGMSVTPEVGADLITGGKGTAAEHAELLRKHLQKKPLGMHWSTDERISKRFTHRNVRDPRTDVPVVLHADKPAEKDIEKRTDVLKNNGVWQYGYESGDAEVPIRRGRPLTVRGISWKPDAEHPEADEDGWVHHTFSEPLRRTAAAEEFTPTKRLFGPTYGLDHRLFDGDHLKPEVRGAVLQDLNDVLEPVLGPKWMDFVEVYFAGSEASEWTSETLEGNGDFDTLLGINYDALRHRAPAFAGDETNPEIDDELNALLREKYNRSPWVTPFGTYDRTGYVNDDAYDIRKIRPYAAYDLNKDEWAVRPPHLPDWSIQKMNPAVVAEARAVEAYIKSVLALPEPMRTQQGAALWDHLHSDRSRAFSSNGEGWWDSANIIEKWLDQEGLWAQLLALKKNYVKGGGNAPEDWSNDPYASSPATVDRGATARIHQNRAERLLAVDKVVPAERLRQYAGDAAEAWIRDGSSRGVSTMGRTTDSRGRRGSRMPQPGSDVPGRSDVYSPAMRESRSSRAEGSTGQHSRRPWTISGSRKEDALSARSSVRRGEHVSVSRDTAVHDLPSPPYRRRESAKEVGPQSKRVNTPMEALASHDWSTDIDSDDYERSHTDWDKYYDKIRPEIHRGMVVNLDPEDHDRVHDPSGTDEERGEALLHALKRRPVGMHWSDYDPEFAREVTDDEANQMSNPRKRANATQVVLHADKPQREHIETDMHRLVDNGVMGYASGSEGEIPLKEGAPVHVYGVSWKHRQDPDWHYHELDEPMRHTASSDGDAWVTCDKGHRHWGTNGAAGMLIRHTDDAGTRRYLLQKRAPWVDHGDTWGIPGGALGGSESPEEGARRETEEEMGELPHDLRHSHTVTDDHGGWGYSTVIADSPHMFTPEGGDDAEESQGHGWFTPEEMKDLPLHPGFKKTWDTVRRSRTDKTAERKGVQYWYDHIAGLGEGYHQLPSTPSVGKALEKHMDEHGIPYEKRLRGAAAYTHFTTHKIIHHNGEYPDAVASYKDEKRGTFGHNLHLRDIHVHPSAQHQGIGTQLLREMARRHPDAETMDVHNAVSSAAPWYEKNGAEFDPYGPGYGHGTWDADALNKLREGGTDKTAVYDPATHAWVPDTRSEAERAQAAPHPTPRARDMIRDHHRYNEDFDYAHDKLHPVAQQRFRDSLNMMSEDPTVVGMNRKALHGLLTEGRMKTLTELHHETTQKSGPSGLEERTDHLWPMYYAGRDAYEQHVMGLAGTKPEHRPIYGSVTDAPESNPYGNYQVELKPHVRNRTTVTMGDSFNTRRIPKPIDDVPHLSHDEVREMTDRDEVNHLGTNGVAKTYMEAQVHGGLRPSDVARVHIYHTPDDTDRELFDRARQHGIDVVHHDEDREPQWGLDSERIGL